MSTTFRRLLVVCAMAITMILGLGLIVQAGMFIPRPSDLIRPWTQVSDMPPSVLIPGPRVKTTRHPATDFRSSFHEHGVKPNYWVTTMPEAVREQTARCNEVFDFARALRCQGRVRGVKHLDQSWQNACYNAPRGKVKRKACWEWATFRSLWIKTINRFANQPRGMKRPAEA